MGLRRGTRAPSLFIPDVESALVFGAADGAAATEEPGRARILVLPAHVPDALVAPARSAWSLMPTDRAARTYDLPVVGAGAHDVLRGTPQEHAADREHHAFHEGRGGHDDHDHRGDDGEHGHGGHDHGDMMAITGEPSADGLVMEAMDVQAGPIGVALPGGLVVHARVDGDVVAECQVRQTLTAGDGGTPDPWSALAWAAAALAAGERAAGVTANAGRWFRLAAIEVERAVSHLAWLHGFCRLLGWEQMTGRVRSVLARVLAARGALPVELAAADLPDAPAAGIRDDLAQAGAASRELAGALERSRAFARRTAGLGRLTAADVRSRALAGPIARASGVTSDARAGDPGYVKLGFEPLVCEEGDARARALVRAREAAQALELAAAALEHLRDEAGTPSFGRPPAGVAESARGPVRVLSVGDGAQRMAPGARAAREAAADLAVGREWAAALVTIASFDISPWRVGP